MKALIYMAGVLSAASVFSFGFWAADVGGRNVEAWLFSTYAIVFGWTASILWVTILALAGRIIK